MRRWLWAPVVAGLVWAGCDRASDRNTEEIAPASGREMPDTATGTGPAGTPVPDTLGPRDIGQAEVASPPPEAARPSSASFQGTTGPVRQPRPDSPLATQRAIRTAAQEGYDRVVFEFSGDQVPGYEVEYVDGTVRACGSGDVVPLAGESALSVRFRAAQAHTPEGRSTLPSRTLAPNHPVVKEVKLICDFEGELQWVLGLASRNPYRIAALTSPARLVVDIQH